MTIQIPDEKAAAFQAHAAAAGLTLEQWLEQLGEQDVQLRAITHLQETNPREWARQFLAWADSHDPNTPVLADDAMSRESIYPDRI